MHAVDDTVQAIGWRSVTSFSLLTRKAELSVHGARIMYISVSMYCKCFGVRSRAARRVRFILEQVSPKQLVKNFFPLSIFTSYRGAQKHKTEPTLAWHTQTSQDRSEGGSGLHSIACQQERWHRSYNCRDLAQPIPRLHQDLVCGERGEGNHRTLSTRWYIEVDLALNRAQDSARLGCDLWADLTGFGLCITARTWEPLVSKSPDTFRQSSTNPFLTPEQQIHGQKLYKSSLFFLYLLVLPHHCFF